MARQNPFVYARCTKTFVNKRLEIFITTWKHLVTTFLIKYYFNQKFVL